MAFALAVLGLALSAWLLFTGHTVGGSVLGGGTLVALVALFIRREQEEKRDRES